MLEEGVTTRYRLLTRIRKLQIFSNHKMNAVADSMRNKNVVTYNTQRVFQMNNKKYYFYHNSRKQNLIELFGFQTRADSQTVRANGETK